MDTNTKTQAETSREDMEKELRRVESCLGIDLKNPDGRKFLVDEMSRMDMIKEFMR